MPKPYSDDLRGRVVEAVAKGATRRAAAARFSISASSAIKWMQRWSQSGSAEAKAMGGSRSPLDDHAEVLLELVAAEPDLTLDEIRVAAGARGIRASRTALWRFYDRHKISFKKNRARQRAGSPGRGPATGELARGSSGT